MEDAIDRVLEATKAVSFLVYTGKGRASYDFKKDVREWLGELDVPFRESVVEQGVSTKLFNIPFVVDKEDGVPAFLQPLHAETKGYAEGITNRTVVQWVELRGRSELKFKSISLVDNTDAEEIWAPNLKLLQAHSDRVGLWDQREDLAEILA